MKKTLLFSLTGLIVLVFAASLAFAAGPATPPPCDNQQSALTDSQRQELAPLFTQMIEVRKQMVQKLADFGVLTQEQADQRVAWMERRAQNGFGPGMMGRGPGMRQGRLDLSTLSDAQKQELTPLINQMADLHKQMIQKQVAFGNLTQEQADQRLAWAQERASNAFTAGPMGHHGPGMMRGYGSMANLTDAQKQELTPLFNQMFELRKQILQKQVEFGNLTQEQADQRISAMQQRAQNGFGPGMMGHGHGGSGGPGMERGSGMMGGASGYGPCQQQQPAK